MVVVAVTGGGGTIGGKTHQQNGIAEEDLLILSRWVRKELFSQVKFLYNPESDLKVSGRIFNMFARDCKDRLVGLKLNARSSSEYRKLYVQSIWAEGTKKKCNLVADGLTARRSSIYSAMQNRFTELCNLCVKEQAVMPSLEAFEMRLEIPSVYMVFYEFFFKSSVGDSQWKASCLEAEEQTDLLAPLQGEAFAMLVLKNNYFAWLWEAKLCFRELLVTDYDCDEDISGKANIGDAFLKMEIDLNGSTGEEEGQENENNLEFSSGLLISEGEPRYQDLKRKSQAALNKARQEARESDKYKKLKKELEDQVAQQDEVGQEESDEQKQRIKRRRVLKSFRQYTNPKDDEGRFKGWSHRAQTDMVELLTELKADGTKAELFRKAYRLTYHRKQQANGKKQKPVQESAQHLNYESEIWGLPEIEEPTY